MQLTLQSCNFATWQLYSTTLQHCTFATVQPYNFATLYFGNPAALQACSFTIPHPWNFAAIHFITMKPWIFVTMQACSYASLQLCNPAALQPCSYATLHFINCNKLQPCNFISFQNLGGKKKLRKIYSCNDLIINEKITILTFRFSLRHQTQVLKFLADGWWETAFFKGASSFVWGIF